MGTERRPFNMADGLQQCIRCGMCLEACPTYQLTGHELYVRAVVTSTKKHWNPSFENQTEQAWTQPIGWEKHVQD